MKILLIGGGGREHAMAEAILKNTAVTNLYCAPGNGGTKDLERTQNIALATKEELLHFAKEEHIDLTIVGPEALLAEGIADLFETEGLRIFGTKKKGAELESSKAFSKDFMKKYGVRTADYEVFSDSKKARQYLESYSNYPVVIKASGLALGKGVLICENQKEALIAVEQLMDKKIFSDAGNEIVIEEFLEGQEASILTVVSHDKAIVPFLSAKDHKRIFDGDLGENTGGMGAICPNPLMTESAWIDFEESIIKPTMAGLQKEKMDFTGTIFFGLMLTQKGVYLLEYNVRFGDPETQAVLPMLESDFVTLLENAIDGTLEEHPLKWKNGHSVCITAVSGGYPNFYAKNLPIQGIDRVDNATVYIAGAEYDELGVLKTTGGRVLNVVATANTFEEAQRVAYQEIEKISYAGIFYRKDIGVIRK